MANRRNALARRILPALLILVQCFIAPIPAMASPNDQVSGLTLEFSPPGPVSAGTDITVTARTADPSFSTIRIVPDCGQPGIYELGSTVATFAWHTGGCTADTHLIVAEARRADNPDWDPSTTPLVSQKVALSPGSPPSPPTQLTGDINWDCTVDYRDRMLVRGAFTNFVPRADLNDDGVVNSFDYSIVINNEGHQCQSPPQATLNLGFAPPSGPVIGTSVSIMGTTSEAVYSTYRVMVPCGSTAQPEAQTVTTIVWQTAGCAPGTYQVQGQARRFDDSNWTQPISATVSYTLVSANSGDHGRG